MIFKMTKNKKGILGLNTTVLFIVALLILAVMAFVLIIIVSIFAGTQEPIISSSVNDYISNIDNPTTISGIGKGLTSLASTRKNDTWLNCSIDDSITLEVTQSKSTITLWFNNETTDWTSIIKAGGNIYINGALENTWTFFPYFISGDDITLCKSDGSTFLNVSIDEFRVYESALNTTEVTTVFNEGR